MEANKKYDSLKLEGKDAPHTEIFSRQNIANNCWQKQLGIKVYLQLTK